MGGHRKLVEKKDFQDNKYKRLAVAIFSVGAALILFYYVVNHIPVIKYGIDKVNDVLMPFYLGIIMAFLLCPIYNGTVRMFYRVNKGRFKRPINDLKLAKIVASVISVIVLIAVIAGFFMMIIPDLWDSIVGIIRAIPSTIDTVQDWLSNHRNDNPEITLFLQEKLESISDSALSWAEDKVLGPGAEIIVNGVIGTVSSVFDILVALIICVYILNSKEIFMAQTKKLLLATLSKEKAEKIFDLGRLTNQTFGGFINGKIIDSIIIGILCFIAMTIMELPLTLLVSVVVGITNIIPFFGPIIGAVPSVILLLIIDPMAALKFLIMVIILQQLDGNIIGPKILGKSTNIASFWVMFSIIVGGGFFGFPGMILGVPTFAVIYFYVTKGINSKLQERELPTDTIIYENFNKYNIKKEDLFGKERFRTDKESSSEISKTEDR